MLEAAYRNALAQVEHDEHQVRKGREDSHSDDEAPVFMIRTALGHAQVAYAQSQLEAGQAEDVERT